MKIEQSVPKRQHIKFRRRGITQKKHTTFRTRRQFEIKSYFAVIYGHVLANFIEKCCRWFILFNRILQPVIAIGIVMSY